MNSRIYLAAIGLLFGFPLGRAAVPEAGRWGIDAGGATVLADPPTRAAYFEKLRAAGVGIVRERGANPAMASLHAAGFKVVSILDLGALPVEQRGDVLQAEVGSYDVGSGSF